MLGKSLKLYVKDIIDSNATGPYGTPGGGNSAATQPICDLSNYNKIAYCLCAYAGSGTSCTDTFYNCPTGTANTHGVWRDNTVLPNCMEWHNQSDIRTFILNVETANWIENTRNYIYSQLSGNDIYPAYLTLKGP